MPGALMFQCLAKKNLAAFLLYYTMFVLFNLHRGQIKKKKRELVKDCFLFLFESSKLSVFCECAAVLLNCFTTLYLCFLFDCVTSWIPIHLIHLMKTVLVNC